MAVKPKRILLKLSGESLLGDREYGIDPKFTKRLANEIKGIVTKYKDLQISIVIGGGNIFRGMKAAANGMDRSTADYMGMLATLLNALALRDAFESVDCSVRVQSALNIPQIGELYIRQRAIRHLEKNRIIILACGTGNPFFTTDTAAALRALELDCDILLKATKVDGVYDRDPALDMNANKFNKISYNDVLSKDLSVMDSSAISLCREHKLPIKVFSLVDEGNIEKAIFEKDIGTIIC